MIELILLAAIVILLAVGIPLLRSTRRAADPNEMRVYPPRKLRPRRPPASYYHENDRR